MVDWRSMGGEPGDPTSCQVLSWRGTGAGSMGGGDATLDDVAGGVAVVGGGGTAAWRPESAAGRVASGFRPVGRVVGAGEGLPLGGFRPVLMATLYPPRVVAGKGVLRQR